MNCIFLIVSFGAGLGLSSLFFLERIRRLRKTIGFDRLTKLPNYELFESRFREEWQRAKRNNSELCLILLDVDKFKTINDSFGYQVGDKVLYEFAQFLKSEVRLTDLLFRYKLGDEFALLIPGADVLQAESLMKRLTELLMTKYTSEGASLLIGLSFTYGIVSFKSTQISANEMIIKAENLLRKNKQNA